MVQIEEKQNFLVDMDVIELVIRLMMDAKLSFKVKHECVMVMVALLFGGNKRAQIKV